ncbi:hypothetical protein BDN72DRAFT_162783 [Pluteus cervinus]|uniref:Uncharacterized protein n=1 Tax=Pluteus cervinus TaxID=181527 RepID=A0ACD3AKC5_9AGAR|nr:hypothetical protein BDN72DRAFT_162783 [Pluteus cervinus]
MAQSTLFSTSLSLELWSTTASRINNAHMHIVIRLLSTLYFDSYHLLPPASWTATSIRTRLTSLLSPLSSIGARSIHECMRRGQPT